MDATILAVLAVAVFQNRAELLMQCAGRCFRCPATTSSTVALTTSPPLPVCMYARTDAEALLSEGSRLKVVPLLQMSLFVEKDS